jgi:hypothetical protein
VRCNLGLPIPPLPPRVPLVYTMSRTRIAPFGSSLTMKGNGPVVAIGVDGRSVGCDNGPRRGIREKGVLRGLLTNFQEQLAQGCA